MILPKYVHFNGLKLISALKEFSILHFTIFWFQNAKFNFLKKIRVLSAFYSELKYRRFQTRLADLKKYQTSECLLMNEFL